MYDLINQAGNFTARAAFDSFKNFSYDLIVNQSALTSVALFSTTLALTPVIERTSESNSLIGGTIFYTSFIAAGVSCYACGMANIVRLTRALSEPSANLSDTFSTFLSRNFSPVVSENVSEYALGTFFALGMTVIAYDLMNKKKWTIYPSSIFATFMTVYICNQLLQK